MTRISTKFRVSKELNPQNFFDNFVSKPTPSLQTWMCKKAKHPNMGAYRNKPIAYARAKGFMVRRRSASAS
jgi:hypothetical protein